MSNLFQPGISDGFQKQLDDLQRSYAQLGEKIASNTAAYVLSVMGKWVANAPAAAT